MVDSFRAHQYIFNHINDFRVDVIICLVDLKGCRVAVIRKYSDRTGILASGQCVTELSACCGKLRHAETLVLLDRV